MWGGDPIGFVDPDGMVKQQGNLPGTNIPYRMDMHQQPYPNMHVKWPNGTETVVRHTGGWERTHGGQAKVPPPAKYRDAFRQVARKFVKQAARVVRSAAGAVKAVVAPPFLEDFARAVAGQACLAGDAAACAAYAAAGGEICVPYD